ncbi:MAG: hypothetical protein HYU59_06430 [Magnetospirillum gryphiswaldense]|nr:hypothetical protein [Magnetospirillum gryphiswaldense]
MLTDAHRFITQVSALHGLDNLTPSQCADLSSYLRAGFPTTDPQAFKALRDVLHLRQIPIEHFAAQFNAVLRVYKDQTGAKAESDVPGNRQQVSSNRTKRKHIVEGALQGKSVIFPGDPER